MHMGYRLKKFFLILGLCSATSVVSGPKMIDRVAAVVNNDVILESSVNEKLMAIKNSTDPSELPDDRTLRDQIIERLIIDRLILEISEKSTIKVTDSDVTNAINHIAKQNNISVNELKDHLLKSGINFSDYRKRIHKEMLIEETRMNEVRRRISISPQEVETLAKVIEAKPRHNMEVDVSHILIATPESSTPSHITSAQNKANQIIKKLKQGEKFERLATAYSNDQAALSGGHLGWKKPSELPSLFEEHVANAHRNQIIGPLQSGVGFHILKVNDVRKKTKKPVNVLETNARHILLKTNVIFSDKEAREKLVQLRETVLQNKLTFNEAAKQFSDDVHTKNTGGELGWTMPEKYDAAFRAALLNLKKGEISQPVKSAFGWHLIQLLGTRQEDRSDLAYKDQAYREIFNRKFSEEAQIWMQHLRDDAYINIVDDK